MVFLLVDQTRRFAEDTRLDCRIRSDETNWYVGQNLGRMRHLGLRSILERKRSNKKPAPVDEAAAVDSKSPSRLHSDGISSSSSDSSLKFDNRDQPAVTTPVRLTLVASFNPDTFLFFCQDIAVWC